MPLRGSQVGIQVVVGILDHVGHTNVLARHPTVESALLRRVESHNSPVMSLETSGNKEIEIREPALPGPFPGVHGQV